MLEVYIEGQKSYVPQCTCGKCIKRRRFLRKEPELPYVNLSTTYVDHYPPKQRIPDPGYYNRSQHNSHEGEYKPHLPNGFQSTMKGSYIPHKVEVHKPKKEPYIIYSDPFSSRTTNGQTYIDFGAPEKLPRNDDDEGIPEIKVPFRGETNYNENYIKYPSYEKRQPIMPTVPDKKDLPLDDLTIYNKDYVEKKVPYEGGAHKPNDEILDPENAPDAFDTTYRRHYINYDDGMCRLRKYLDARGMRYLVI